MKTIILVLAALTLNTTANAQNSLYAGEIKAIQGALDARNEIVNAFETKDFTEVTHNGFERAIQVAVQDLRDRSDNAMADELQNQWNTSNFESALFMASLDDLGDHGVLFPWLDKFFAKMSAKYGSIVLSLPYVQDLNTLNYAIPVVFSPKGAWQVVGADNRIEYRKHFIPFANIITYYASLYGCKYIAVQQGIPELKKICGKVATKLKFVMGRYVAPPVSDWIFKTVNHGTRGSIKVTSSQLRYNTAEELRAAIQE